MELKQGVVCLPELSHFKHRLFQGKGMIENWMCTYLLAAERTKDKKYRLYLQNDAFSYTIPSDYLYNIGLILNP